MPSDSQTPKLKIGISSCLLGQSVRYDGGHSHSQTCTDFIEQHFVYVPFCPEVSAGFGTPRAPMNLVGDSASPKLKYVDISADKHNSALNDKLISGFLAQLDLVNELDGYITKSRSPSCGFGSTPLYLKTGERSSETDSGLFISALKERYPKLPIVEETELEDEVSCARFLDQVYFYHQLQN
ncbi:MAG: DUF523 domain-containing protein [Pseudomonadales bacterium]|nr:DUF523 domain-containing protein [Pseudomonadales bacterium]